MVSFGLLEVQQKQLESLELGLDRFQGAATESTKVLKDGSLDMRRDMTRAEKREFWDSAYIRQMQYMVEKRLIK